MQPFKGTAKRSLNIKGINFLVKIGNDRKERAENIMIVIWSGRSFSKFLKRDWLK